MTSWSDSFLIGFYISLSIYIYPKQYYVCDLQVGLKLASISPSDLYYDMEYCVDYSTFRNIQTGVSLRTTRCFWSSVFLC